MTPDLELFFDPVCPFCWQTSKFVRQVQRLRDLDVGYRFISLRFLNEPLGYAGRPELYPQVHRQGTRLLRVCAAARQAYGEVAVGELYRRMGEVLWEADPPAGDGFDAVLAYQAEGIDIPGVLRAAGLSEELAAAADREDHDPTIRAETHEALRRAGEGVGTPILSFSPPDGPAFFGPVISQLPSDDEAIELYDAIVRLASWPGFAELKRSLRSLPEVELLGSMRGQQTAVS
ncbi:MAG: hypothetical protein ACLFRD_07765 [Nitriliruptoraceae bacterium]